jgi:hypothetical protein
VHTSSLKRLLTYREFIYPVTGEVVYRVRLILLDPRTYVRLFCLRLPEFFRCRLQHRLLVNYRVLLEFISTLNLNLQLSSGPLPRIEAAGNRVNNLVKIFSKLGCLLLLLV